LNWRTVFKNVLEEMSANVTECRIVELPEPPTSNPKNSVLVDVSNLVFYDTLTLILKVQFELSLDEKESIHTRQSVKTNKRYPASSFINEFSVVEKTLEKCCKRFDKVKGKYLNGKQ